MQSSGQRVIWVTGASSGLGRSIALQLANRGALVIASARNQQALDELAAQSKNIPGEACEVSEQSLIDKSGLATRALLTR